MSYWALEKRVYTLFMEYEPISLNLAYFSVLKFMDYILVYGARWLLMLDGDSLILLDLIKLDFTNVLYYHDNPLTRFVILGFVVCMYIFLLLVRVYGCSSSVAPVGYLNTNKIRQMTVNLERKRKYN